jgi:hypothetical protein
MCCQLWSTYSNPGSEEEDPYGHGLRVSHPVWRNGPGEDRTGWGWAPRDQGTGSQERPTSLSSSRRYGKMQTVEHSSDGESTGSALNPSMGTTKTSSPFLENCHEVRARNYGEDTLQKELSSKNG